MAGTMVPTNNWVSVGLAISVFIATKSVTIIATFTA